MQRTLADVPDLKATLEAQSPQEFELLHQAGLYYRLVRILRSTAWVNLFWGGLTLWVGLVPPATFLSTAQAILGVLIIIQSLLALIRPRAWVLLALAILLVVVGLWNLFINLYPGAVSIFTAIHVMWAIIAIVQLRWAYRTYRLYRVFSAHPTPKPASELVQKYERMWEGLAYPTPILSTELLMVQLQGSRYWWNVFLLPDWAILAHKRQRMLMVVAKSDFIVVPDNPKAVQRDQVAIFAQIGAELWRGKTYPASFQQYLKWKGIVDPQAELDRNIRRKRLSLELWHWFSILLGFIFIYAMVTAMAQMPRLH
jgi:hypothetical protein